VIGAIILVIVLVIFPTLLLMSAAPIAALISWALDRNAVEEHAGSELVELNR
jgi:hypothetical protein